MQPRARFQPSGFTLIEVTLSIGIVAGVLIALVALFSTGLGAMQQSQHQLQGVQIYNAIEAELSSTSFQQLESYVNGRFPVYYDNEGAEVGNTGFVYRAECTLLPAEMGGELRRASVAIWLHGETSATPRTFLLVNKEGQL